MKELFLLLLFIVGTAATLPEYHGDRRFWTVVDSNGRTKVALHVLNEPVNLSFPNDKTIAQILLDTKLLSPSGNEKCQDTTNTMGFTLLFDEHNHIRGEIKIESDYEDKAKMYLYEKCGHKILKLYQSLLNFLLDMLIYFHICLLKNPSENEVQEALNQVMIGFKYRI